MKELDFLKIINNTLDVNSYLGNDCAYLEDLGIFVTHDTLVQDVHFTMYTTSPYMLGRKSVAVNLSDLAASLSIPKYITVSLSLPNTVEGNFVSELYKGINDICNEYGVAVIGGDITASDKIVISVCAIGKKSSSYLSQRNNANKDDYIVIAGTSGSSAAGLFALQNFLYADEKLIQAQINPLPKIREAEYISKFVDRNITAMDTSDGLIDALYKIAFNSKRSVEIDINKVPIDNELLIFSKQNNLDYKEFVKWGGEDYSLVLCIPSEIFDKIDDNMFKLIGSVNNKDNSPSVTVIDGNVKEVISEKIFMNKTYNHFKGILC